MELRFDPFALEQIEVFYAGRPFGVAAPHRIARHIHPQAQQPADRAAPQTGIDYLRLIEAEHERSQLSRRINYHQLGDVETDQVTDNDNDDGDDGAAPAPAVRR